MNILELPFNAFVGIERSPKEGFVLSLPSDEKYTNHLGTVHAGALVALAEATSGEGMIALSNQVEADVIPIVRRLETKFKKPASGRIHSKFRVEEEKVNEFIDQLNAKGRSVLSVGVEIFNEEDTLAMTATVDWFVSKK